MAAVPATPAATPRATVRVLIWFLLTIACEGCQASRLRSRSLQTPSGEEGDRARRSGEHGAEEAKDEAAPEGACARQESQADARGRKPVAPPPRALGAGARRRRPLPRQRPLRRLGRRAGGRSGDERRSRARRLGRV